MPKEPQAPDLATVRNRAVALLARREHTRVELRRKLQQRALPAELIEQALNELAAENLLSETRYAEALVHSRVSRGYGPLKILAEAQENGADEALIQQALDAAAVDWRSLAGEVRRKRFGREPRNLAERVKQSRFLASRGFSAETVRKVVGDLYD